MTRDRAAILERASVLLESVAGNLETRRRHPSYGYTKAGMREKLQVAEGAIRACAMLEGAMSDLYLTSAMLEEAECSAELYRLAQRRIELSHELRRAR